MSYDLAASVFLATGLLALPSSLPALGQGDAYSRIARQLIAPEWEGAAVAVLPFRYEDARDSVGGEAVAEAIQSKIPRSAGAEFIDRRRLLKAKEDLLLNRSGLSVQEADLSLGSMAGARFLVTGTIADVGDGMVEVYARVLRAGSATLLRAASARVRKDWVDMPALRSKFVPSPLSVPIPEEGGRIPAPHIGCSGLTQLVRGRVLGIRYAQAGGTHLLGVMDCAPVDRLVWRETPIPFDAATGIFEPFSVSVRLAGHRYRLWSDYGTTVRIAPRQALVGPADPGGTAVFRLSDLLQAWRDDVDQRMKIVPAKSPGRRIVAYLEPLDERRLRVSLFPLNPQGRLEYETLGMVELPILKEKVSSSGNLKVEGHGFRFHYVPESREVVVESH